MKRKSVRIFLSVLFGIILVCLTSGVIALINPVFVKEHKVWNPVTSPDNQTIAFRCFFASLLIMLWNINGKWKTGPTIYRVTATSV